MTLYYMRVLCLALWVVAAILLSPAVIRYARGNFGTKDEYQAAFFFTALVFVGGLGRWLIIPFDTQVFVAIYALTAVLATYVIILVSQGWAK